MKVRLNPLNMSSVEKFHQIHTRLYIRPNLLPYIMYRIILIIILFAPQYIQAQSLSLHRVDPPFWWTDMEQEHLELLVYGTNIAGSTVRLDYPGVRVDQTTQVQNPNYLFISLTITDEAAPGLLPLVFEKNDSLAVVQYELKKRRASSSRQSPVTQADLIYLIMPDRFVNGDPSNDQIEGLQDQGHDRSAKYHRHGGDLMGIESRLDYLQSLGVTTLWLNPVEINDQPHESYHGYAATDHYKVDPRLGGNDAYASLVTACHDRGMKVIRDVVYNHVGDQHWILQDLPSADWVHQWPEFTKTSYRAPTLLDPYASSRDRKIMSHGWFDTHMPDLNQDNHHLATYMIQNSIWWIEHYGVNGYRIDTYAYPDQEFMADWAAAILTEYPDFSFFGETWVHNVPVQSWFTAGTAGKGFDSKMAGVTDFQLQYAIQAAMHEAFGWTEGVSRLYYVLAQDYVYKDPWQNVIFLDNHDISRFYATVNEDMSKMKMATAFLLTTRGIPQIYYGTEILMDEPFDWDNHDMVRQEFPGGWEGDRVNKFDPLGRTEQENEYFTYFQRLATFRRVSPALTQGSLTQFVPEDGIYTFSRIHPSQTILVIMNQNDEARELNLNRFSEVFGNASRARDIMTDEAIDLSESLAISPRTVMILELL